MQIRGPSGVDGRPRSGENRWQLSSGPHKLSN